MKIFSIKRITKEGAGVYGTKIYLCLFGKPIKMLHNYRLLVTRHIIYGARHPLLAATTFVDDRIKYSYVFEILANS